MFLQPLKSLLHFHAKSIKDFFLILLLLRPFILRKNGRVQRQCEAESEAQCRSSSVSWPAWVMIRVFHLDLNGCTNDTLWMSSDRLLQTCGAECRKARAPILVLDGITEGITVATRLTSTSIDSPTSAAFSPASLFFFLILLTEGKPIASTPLFCFFDGLGDQLHPFFIISQKAWQFQYFPQLSLYSSQAAVISLELYRWGAKHLTKIPDSAYQRGSNTSAAYWCTRLSMD